MSKTPTRIYTVKRSNTNSVRLVRATSQAQALRHVALDEYTVEVAGQDELVRALHDGADVETAAAEPAVSDLSKGAGDDVTQRGAIA
ncbi:hypothetical protein SAMN02800692_1551 [Luteibacter sp. UNC138MFCol5.1]|uniref:hypothetical protein n=1 Tax=Luteibacter sp. UNC138MFCol5.1 TaxID=1502774 RepID=UPI0008D0C873|nr:hypothetical protein [Luteibacter sp. UNC138MFCol5.1]SEO64076.1 hypothetical protein SAMN02800692_1551 [Luteibacter sp. UNC138MFCol5.1]